MRGRHGTARWRARDPVGSRARAASSRASNSGVSEIHCLRTETTCHVNTDRGCSRIGPLPRATVGPGRNHEDAGPEPVEDVAVTGREEADAAPGWTADAELDPWLLV